MVPISCTLSCSKITHFLNGPQPWAHWMQGDAVTVPWICTHATVLQLSFRVSFSPALPSLSTEKSKRCAASMAAACFTTNIWYQLSEFEEHEAAWQVHRSCQYFLVYSIFRIFSLQELANCCQQHASNPSWSYRPLPLWFLWSTALALNHFRLAPPTSNYVCQHFHVSLVLCYQTHNQGVFPGSSF